VAGDTAHENRGQAKVDAAGILPGSTGSPLPYHPKPGAIGDMRIAALSTLALTLLQPIRSMTDVSCQPACLHEY